MSVQAMTRVMEFSQATGMTRFILLLIANHETEDRGAFPSIDRLAHEARCSARTVQEAIGRLKRAGELEVTYRAGPHGTNVYRTICGSRGAAPLDAAETTDSRAPQNLHPADDRRESAPERKEQGSNGSTDRSRSTRSTSAPRAARKPDDLFEAVAEVCLIDWEHDLTDIARGAMNKAVASLRGVKATPAEVRRRAAIFVGRYGQDRLTPTALAKQWPQVAAAHPGDTPSDDLAARIARGKAAMGLT